MDSLTDEELVAEHRKFPGSAQGERVLNELFGRYHKRVALWCYRFTGDRQSAADLAQDIFMKAYKNLESFRGESKFSTWMYTIARNHCTNEIKARAVNPTITVDDQVMVSVPDERAESIESALARMSNAESVRTLVASTLDPTELQVMTLHYGEEFSLDAVTRLLGLTNASGAKAYVVSARRKLGTAIQRWKARQERRTN